jgi:mono/diheme cytochrome c family protein
MSVLRGWTAEAVLLLVITLALPSCAPRHRGQSATAHADSSFAAIEFQHGKPPATLSEARGQVLFNHYCAICHGSTGGGDGFNAYNLKSAFNVTPTAFGDSASFHALDRDTALAMIRDGGAAIGRSPAMPPWGTTLTPGEIVDLWRYIQSLSREPSKD